MATPLRTRGIVEIILSGICFGFLGLFGKMAFDRGFTPGELLSFRFLLGGSLLLLFFLLYRPRHLFLTKWQALHCIVLGVFGYAVFSFCFFSALKSLSASLTVILLYTYPIIVAALAWILFKEKIPKKKWPAIPLCFVGLVVLIGPDFEAKNLSALLFGFGSAIFYSFYILYSRYFLKDVNPYVSGGLIMLSAGVTLSFFHLQAGRSLEQLVLHWPLLIAGTLICTVAAMSLFLSGLQKLASWEASLLSTFEPLTGVAVAILILGETLGLAQWLGIVFVGLGFYFISGTTSDSQTE